MMRVRHGFTLLEVLIALLILGIGIIAVMELFPPSLFQARLATERVSTAHWADKELSTLQARGLMGPRDELGWPRTLDPSDAALRFVSTALGEAHLQYCVQPMGLPDIVRPRYQTTPIYALHRVTLSVPMIDGRREAFVTYITKY